MIHYKVLSNYKPILNGLLCLELLLRLILINIVYNISMIEGNILYFI
jgi:hypothetical protein